MKINIFLKKTKGRGGFYRFKHSHTMPFGMVVG